jgi:hypothetical protein
MRLERAGKGYRIVSGRTAVFARLQADDNILDHEICLRGPLNVSLTAVALSPIEPDQTTARKAF